MSKLEITNLFKTLKASSISHQKYSHNAITILIVFVCLAESGEIRKMESSWWDERSACPNSASKSSNNKSKLSLSAVAGIFYILILGMITAIACSLLEYNVVLLKWLI